MSTWKNLLNQAPAPDAGDTLRVDTDGDVDLKPAPQIEISSLEIEIAPEVDCDPYNRTGQFCVSAIDKRDRD